MLHLSADEGSKGSVSEEGKGVEVLCRPLQDVLSELGVGMTHKGQRRIDFASLDIEGFEHRSFAASPFNTFDIPVWLMETIHQVGSSLDDTGQGRDLEAPHSFLSSGREGGGSSRLASGTTFGNLLVRWARPKWMYALNASVSKAQQGMQALSRLQVMAPRKCLPWCLGRSYLPGGLEGESSVAPCSDGAPSELSSASACSGGCSSSSRMGPLSVGSARPMAV